MQTKASKGLQIQNASEVTVIHYLFQEKDALIFKIL